MKTTAPITREQWLEAAVAVFAEMNPAATLPPDKVSCSWPGGGSARKRIGECWSRASSSAKVNEIFISPRLEEPARVVSVLVHELAHAIDDCKNGHKAAYVAVGKSLGLTGKPTQMELPDSVAKVLADAVIAKAGAFPHRKLDMSKRKKKGTYMLKCECTSCKAIWRLTAKVIAQVDGEMSCPICHADHGVTVDGVESESDD
jgi:hypothetical protein